MAGRGVTLRGLEVFAALAASGSVAQAAEATGLSQPAVSQQLRNLEAALGVDLVDHARRPMRLTAAGRSYLVRAETALAALRAGQSELAEMDLSHLSRLSVALIDDFDTEVTPRLATALADRLTRCRFTLTTAASDEIQAAMARGELHLAVAASGGAPPEGILETPLVRDPFILVAPAGTVPPGGDPGEVMRTLPLLRYASGQLISRQIEAQLAAEGLSFETRFEIGANPALLAMVARRIGWAITTPLSCMRAARAMAGIEAHPVPFAPFARRISLFYAADWAGEVPAGVAATLRQLIGAGIVAPALERLPWLEGDFAVIGE